MTYSSRFALELTLWMVLAIGLTVWRTRGQQLSVGLVAAYIANLWLIHWPAAFTYIFPWYLPLDGPEVIAGFEQSLFGMAGFGVGVVLLGPFLTRTLEPPRAHTAAAEQRRPQAGLPYLYGLVGVFSYLVLTPLLGGIPTVNAIASGTNQLIIVGFCLVLWHAWFTKKKRTFALALAAACVIPLVTILREGFLSYGAMAIIAIISFLTVFVRPRWALALMLLVVSYAAFSFYVTYMRDRGEIRAAVWGGETVGVRATSLSKSITTIEWFDPENPQHLMRVNGRLNQNFLVGAAVENLEASQREYARGQTVLEAFQALIPRIVWPNKPGVAGSGDIVSDYTGISFAQNTSIGVGQVMEFYINFGTIGVILGFLIFGALLSLFDTWAAQRLWNGDWLQFAVWYLPGLAMMQAGGSLVEVMSSAGAAMLAALIVNRYISHRQTRYRPTAMPITSG